MTRALVVAVCLAVLAGSAPAVAAERPRQSDLEAELVCPICETTLDQSDAPVARRMKAYIRGRIEAGWSADQIKDALVAEFGEAVLAEPPKRGFDLLAWALPLGGLAVGVVLVGVLAWTWSRRPRDDVPGDGPLDPELDRRVDDALAELDE